MSENKILIISSDKNLRDVLNFCFDGWGYEVALWDNIEQNLNEIKKLGPDAIVIDVHSAKKAELEICQSLKDDFSTLLIPVIALINKRHLRSQLLHLKYGVDDYLIKPPDPLDLRIRVEMSMRRSQHCSNTNALTGLPGARGIEADIKDRLHKNKDFSFGYVDVDNFKYFNDVYGYLKGDSVILHTAYMLYSIIKNYGNSDDFIGHIGGDDFVFVTSPARFANVSQQLIYNFEKSVPFHYTPKDREQGYIVARDRNREERRIDLMSLSVAVVNRQEGSEIKNIIQLNERVTEIKKFIKNIPGSKFMIDRRSSPESQDCGPHVFKRDKNFLKTYRPIGQILLDEGMVTSEQLDEALRSHWKRGVVLGEMLKELGFLHHEKLELALNIQSAISQIA